MELINKKQVYKVGRYEPEVSMTVDLSTLKVGDSIRLRDETVHLVCRVSKRFDSYQVDTKTARAGDTASSLASTRFHYKDGKRSTGVCPGDIVEIIPALTITYDWTYGPADINWLEEQITEVVPISDDEFKEIKEKITKAVDEREVKADAVSPNHYQQNGKQLWDVMPDMATREEFLGYCKLNVVKYVGRYNKKNGIEDLRKAVAYCERMIRFLEEEQK